MDGAIELERCEKPGVTILLLECKDAEDALNPFAVEVWRQGRLWSTAWCETMASARNWYEKLQLRVD